MIDTNNTYKLLLTNQLINSKQPSLINVNKLINTTYKILINSYFIILKMN
jgi:hypothetical protein